MDVLLGLCAICSLAMSVSVAQFPDVRKLASDTQEIYRLSAHFDAQLITARKAARDFREYALSQIWPAIRMTVLSMSIVGFGLLIAALNWLDGEAVVPDLGAYLSNKLGYFLRWEVVERSSLFQKMNPLTDWTISLAFVAALGSILTFSMGTIATFLASWLFPLRWLKWSKLPAYFQGRHNFWRLKKRQLMLILNSRTTVSGPSTGVHD